MYESLGSPTWSIIIGLLVFLFGVSYCVAYILRMAFQEMKDEGGEE
tara:strand:+ start:55 stop:192 length:138 start_codon:yes stop_codon:yes gene_type:complete